jgi:hypothetical protein
MKKIMIVLFGLSLAGCGTSRFEHEKPFKIPSSKIESFPLPPPRPIDLPKKCWIETETTPHAVIERRYCR